MPSPCLDCRVDTAPDHNSDWEWYMVKDEVWAEAGLRADRKSHGEFLCIGCLESRLGRELTPEDFGPEPVNAPAPCDSERLNRRKGLSL